MRNPHKHMSKRGTRVSYDSTEHSTAWTATQHNIPTLTHTYLLQRRTRQPKLSYAKTTHAHGGTGHAREPRFNRKRHGVNSNTIQHTNAHPHLQSVVPDTTIQIVICEIHTSTWVNGARA